MIGFLACLIGTFLPWATVGGFYSESGMDNDGIVALPLAVAGAAAIYFSKAVWLAWLAAAFAISLIVVGILGVIGVKNGIEDLGEIGDFLSIFDLEPKLGSGLFLLIGGAVLALLACVAHARSFATVRPVEEPRA